VSHIGQNRSDRCSGLHPSCHATRQSPPADLFLRRRLLQVPAFDGCLQYRLRDRGVGLLPDAESRTPDSGAKCRGRIALRGRGGASALHAKLALIPDWRSFLEDKAAEEPSETLHLHSRTGRALGSGGFVEQVEKRLGRVLRRQRPGPKPKDRDTATDELFSE